MVLVSGRLIPPRKDTYAEAEEYLRKLEDEMSLVNIVNELHKMLESEEVMDKAPTTNLILDLTFYAIDEDGNELKNSWEIEMFCGEYGKTLDLLKTETKIL